MTAYKKLLFFIFYLVFSNYCLADSTEYESVDNLKELTTSFINKNVALETDETVEIQINPSDLPRQLAKCDQKIDATLPKESAREKIHSIELTCAGNQPWHVFIPVDVQIFTKVVTAKYPIAIDTSISEADLDYAQANINHLFNGYFKDKSEVINFVTSHVINAGSVISKTNVHRPQLVHKNQEVDLVARKNAIEVRMKGIAKSDGGLHDAITAYNPSSKKTVEAIVVGLNSAEVIS